MATPNERPRRVALFAGLFALLLLAVVLASLLGTCRSGDEATSDQVAPPEGQGPAPGVE